MLTPFQIVQLAARIPCSTRTIQRLYSPDEHVKCSEYSRARADRAARELGLPPPPAPITSEAAR